MLKLLGVGMAVAAMLPAQLGVGRQPDADNSDAEERAFFENLLAPMVEGAKATLGRRLDLQRKLNSQVVAEVKFQSAPLDAVVAFVRDKSKELDPAREGFNVLAMPEAEKAAAGKTVTLELKNVPLGTVLRYATELLGLGYRVDEFAVVIVDPSTVSSGGLSGMPINPAPVPQRAKP